MHGELAVGHVEAEYVEIAVAELFVVLVVELGECGGFAPLGQVFVLVQMLRQIGETSVIA
jgi:hypothetical protein